jgi:O-antigen ligase
MLLTQVALLPGAASPFRLVKSAVLVGGLAIMVGLTLAGRLRRGALELPRGPLSLVLAAFPILMLISTLWSVNPPATLINTVAAAVLVLAILVVGTLSEAAWARALLFCGIGASLSSLVMVLQLIKLQVPFEVVTRGREGGRLSLTGLSGNPADLAITAVLLLPLLLVWTPKKHGWLRWLLVGLLALITLFSQTFTAIFALSLTGLSWLILRGPRRRLWLTAAVALLLLCAAAAGIALTPRFDNLRNRLRDGDWYVLLSARSDGWTASAQMIRTSPTLGVGGSGYTYAYYPNRLAWLEERGLRGRQRGLDTHFETAHCDPLQVVCELGLIGALWLLALAGVMVRAVRRDRLLPLLVIAAILPMTMLHYPGHLAIGLAPMVLAIGKLVESEPRISLQVRSSSLRAGLILLLLAALTLVVVWQGRRIESSYWLGMANRTIDVAMQTGGQRAAIVLQEIERQVLLRVPSNPIDTAELWRVAGRARLGRGAAQEAEAAFLESYRLWAHEEAEMGLGLAQVQQGRRTEAMYHLGRVCTSNPTLLKLIGDERLQRSVRDLVHAKTRAPGAKHEP